MTQLSVRRKGLVLRWINLPREFLRLPSYRWLASRGRGDELESAAFWGLVQAALHYDPDEGDFPPYAARVIRNEMAAEARWLFSPVRMPRNCKEPCLPSYPLHDVVCKEELPREDYDASDARRALESLPARQREVLERCYLRGQTLEEAGRGVGVSHQAMSKRRTGALKLARLHLTGE